MAENMLAAANLYADEIIDEEEPLSLMEESEEKAPVFQYWKSDQFQLECLTENECLSEFRFCKEDIPRLALALRLPEKFICRNGTVSASIEGLCILLSRFVYPCRYSDLIPRFGRSKSELCLISNEVMRYVSDTHGHLLETFDQDWLHPNNLSLFAEAVHRKSNALSNCWGFIDGTVRPICHPEENQRMVYNGHIRVHALKYQSIVAANGLIANLYGPVEGKAHDAGILRRSGILEQLQNRCNTAEGQPLCIYGDPAYPQRAHLQGPYKHNNQTENKKAFNSAMSSVRVTVEWVFSEIAQNFAFLDFKKKPKDKLISSWGDVQDLCIAA